MKTATVKKTDNRSLLDTLMFKKAFLCCNLFLWILFFFLDTCTLRGAETDRVLQENNDDKTLEKQECKRLEKEINYIYNELRRSHNQTSEAFRKIAEAQKRGEIYQKELRYKEAIYQYEPAINWYKNFIKMQPRLRTWQNINIKGKLSDQLSEKTKNEWFMLSEELAKDTGNEWLKLSSQLSVATKNKWLKELENAQNDSSRIWIIWLLSMDSLIDYPELAQFMDGAVIDKDDEDTIAMFSDMFTGSRLEYGKWKDSFEDYMTEWQELLSAHCLDKNVEQYITKLIERQMDYVFENLATKRLLSKLPDIKKWFDEQNNLYEDFKQRTIEKKQENQP